MYRIVNQSIENVSQPKGASGRRLPEFLVLIWSLSLCFHVHAQSDGGYFDWRAYVSNQDDPAEWAASVRGYGRKLTGLALVDPVTRTADPQCLSQLSGAVAQAPDLRRLILPVGGLRSARVQERVDVYRDFIAADRSHAWQQIVVQQALAVTEAAPEIAITWQIGNEINSAHWTTTVGSGARLTQARADAPREPQLRIVAPRPMQERARREGEASERGVAPAPGCSRLFADLSRERGERPRARMNDPAVIPVYVEEFLAPTVAGLLLAQKTLAQKEIAGQTPNVSDKYRIALGSIASAGSPGASRWLDDLLNYQIQGKYAPGLAGRTVAEIIDVVTLHYVVTRPGERWREYLDQLAHQWLTPDSNVQAIWSSEEVGKRRALQNAGGATALRVLFRYVDWWRAADLEPGQGLLNVWGAGLGDAQYTAQASLTNLSQTLNQQPVRLLSRTEIKRLVPEIGQGELESYESYGWMAQDGTTLLLLAASDARNGRARQMRPRKEQAMQSQRKQGQTVADSTTVTVSGHDAGRVEIYGRDVRRSVDFKGSTVLSLQAGEVALITLEPTQ